MLLALLELRSYMYKGALTLPSSQTKFYYLIGLGNTRCARADRERTASTAVGYFWRYPDTWRGGYGDMSDAYFNCRPEFPVAPHKFLLHRYAFPYLAAQSIFLFLPLLRSI